MKKYNYDNEIYLEAWLFGGDFGKPTTHGYCEGFNSILGRKTEHFDIFNTFQSFKQEIRNLIDMYGWDTDECITVSLYDNTAPHSNTSVQTFEYPTETELQTWYFRERAYVKMRNLES